jgi:glycosyltransferase involved in cell wall biosynthesis
LAMAHPEKLSELHHANCVIALNPGIRDELITAGCEAARIIALPNGVDLKLFHPVAAAVRSEIRLALGAASADRIFVSPSRFAPKKKIPELIRLWKQLEPAVGFSTKLWIIGNATHEPKRGIVSKAIAAAMAEAGVGTVQLFPGRPQHDIPPFYQAADAYVSLSTQEGQSNALLEAMGCGLPVVAPDTPAVSQLVKDGVNGFLFQPSDYRSALNSLVRCATAPESELADMGRRNRAVIAREYTVDLMAERFSALLTELLTERAANASG